MRAKAFTWLLIVLVCIAVPVGCEKKREPPPDHPRVTANVRMQDVTFHSSALGRDMPYRVFLPATIPANKTVHFLLSASASIVSTVGSLVLGEARPAMPMILTSLLTRLILRRCPICFSHVENKKVCFRPTDDLHPYCNIVDSDTNSMSVRVATIGTNGIVGCRIYLKACVSPWAPIMVRAVLICSRNRLTMVIDHSTMQL